MEDRIKMEDSGTTWKVGRRIVELSELAKQMYCKDCGCVLDLNLTEGETRVGLASVLIVHCRPCGSKNEVHTCSKKDLSEGRPVYNININIVVDLLQYGSPDLLNVLAVLEVPTSSLFMLPSFPPSHPTHPLAGGDDAHHSSLTAQAQAAGFIRRPALTVGQSPTEDNCLKSEDLHGGLTDGSKAAGRDLSSDNINSASLERDVPLCITASSEPKDLCLQPLHSLTFGNSLKTEPAVMSAVKQKRELKGGKREVAEAGHIKNPVQVMNTFILNQTDLESCKTQSLQESCCKQLSTKRTMCDLCGACLSSRSALFRHRQHKHDMKRDPVLCPRTGCKKKFARVELLQKHLAAVHSEVKQYLCPKCGKRFGVKHYMIEHKARCGMQPYQCEVCHQSFSSRSSMHNHRAVTHEGKYHRCILCGKCFTWRTTLVRHQKKCIQPCSAVKKNELEDTR